VGGADGGRAGRDGDPDRHGTECRVPFPSCRVTTNEVRAGLMDEYRAFCFTRSRIWIWGPTVSQTLFERSVVHATERLDGERGVSRDTIQGYDVGRSGTVEKVPGWSPTLASCRYGTVRFILSKSETA
jgi:hypothetical protein